MRAARHRIGCRSAACRSPSRRTQFARRYGRAARRRDVRAGRGAPNFGELSPSGRLRWSAEAHGSESLSIVPPYALSRHVESGGRMVATQDVIRLGPGGGIVGGIADACGVIEVRSPSLVVDGDYVEPMEDHFLTRDVWLADLRTSKIGAQYHYEPDYDTNHDRYFRNDLPMNEHAKSAGTEGDALYIGVARVVAFARPDAAVVVRP